MWNLIPNFRWPNSADRCTSSQKEKCVGTSSQLFIVEGKQKKALWAKFLNRHKLPSCPFAKMIPPIGNHFDKRTAWSLIYFLNHAYLEIWPSVLFFVHPLLDVYNFGFSVFLTRQYSWFSYLVVCLEKLPWTQNQLSKGEIQFRSMALWAQRTVAVVALTMY